MNYGKSTDTLQEISMVDCGEINQGLRLDCSTFYQAIMPG